MFSFTADGAQSAEATQTINTVVLQEVASAGCHPNTDINVTRIVIIRQTRIFPKPWVTLLTPKFAYFRQRMSHMSLLWHLIQTVTAAAVCMSTPSPNKICDFLTPGVKDLLSKQRFGSSQEEQIWACRASILRLILSFAGLRILQFICIFLHLEYEVKANQAPATFHADHRAAAATAWFWDLSLGVTHTNRVKYKHFDVTTGRHVFNPLFKKTASTCTFLWMKRWNRMWSEQWYFLYGFDKSSSCLLN